MRFIIPAATGDRQMFPRHTKRIFRHRSSRVRNVATVGDLWTMGRPYISMILPVVVRRSSRPLSQASDFTNRWYSDYAEVARYYSFRTATIHSVAKPLFVYTGQMD